MQRVNHLAAAEQQQQADTLEFDISNKLTWNQTGVEHRLVLDCIRGPAAPGVWLVLTGIASE